MKKITFLVSLFVINLLCSGQYIVKSQHILTPEINIDEVITNVQFWIDHAYDPVDGGFFSNISRNGKVLTVKEAGLSNGTHYEKSLISQTRQGYGFTRAFMLTGDERYLTYAKSALDFLFDHGWDTVNDGWYSFAKSDGTIDNTRWWNPNTGKWGFTQQYALLGIVANYEATHDPNVKYWMDKGTNSINDHLWDARPGYEGYFEQANLNWTGLSEKGFTSTVDAITTHAELSYLVTQEQAYKTRLAELANIIIKRFIPTMEDARVKVLYPETFNNDWSVKSYSGEAMIGHFIKTAWVLGRAYLCDTTKTEVKDAAIKILDQAWTYKNGSVSIWDHINGGPFNNLRIETGKWGKNGDNKNYWTLEQGFTAPMLNYYISKNPIYLQMADESISFYNNYFIDTTYGETYQELNPAGTTVKVDTKGDDFKANYHSVEFCYYAYLYSNLYYKHQPANLYYKFAPAPTAHSITLTPIPMEDGLLRIKSVTLDGVDFTTFDTTTRTLNIAANQGGVFKVTYESLLKTQTDIAPSLSSNIKMYPNPTTKTIKIDGFSNVDKLEVVDLTGKVLIVRLVTNQTLLDIDLQELKSGIYFVRLHHVSGVTETHKVIKI